MFHSSVGGPPGSFEHHRVHLRAALPRLDKSFYAPSRTFGLRGITSIFGALTALVAAIPICWHFQLYKTLALAIVLLGAYIYKLTIVLHECSHMTLFASRRTSAVVGTVCAGLLGTSYSGYAKAHWLHHKSCGTDEDNGGEGDYHLLEHASALQVLWHLLKPLTGLTFFQAATQYLGVPGREPANAGSPAGVRQLTTWLLPIVVAQAGIALVITGFGRYWYLALVYPVAGATLGLFFSRTRAFCEHVSSGRLDDQCFVRTHEPFWFDKVFFYTLNMNYHVEHHLFPQVPAWQLPRVRRELARAGCLSPEMTSPSILRTVRSRLLEASTQRQVLAGAR
jgi:fatty acid desaturase